MLLTLWYPVKEHGRLTDLFWCHAVL